MAFSVGPSGQTLLFAPKHNIEFVENSKSRSLPNGELLRKKVMLYMRYNVLFARVKLVDYGFFTNTS